MLRNYVKIAWRTLKSNKSFSFINIIGLALGLACSLLILLWVQDERSVDNFHANGDRLYNLYHRQFADGKIDAEYTTPGLLGRELKRVIPEVEYSSGYELEHFKNIDFKAGDKILKEDGGFADADYFSMFSYIVLKGRPTTALNSPESISISEKMARQFFGSADVAIGKTIRYDNKKDLVVTAVFADLPAKASHPFDFLINWDTFLDENGWARSWGNSGTKTVIMLKSGADPRAVGAKIKNFLDHYNPLQTANSRTELGMQLFGDGYLHSNFKDGQLTGGRIEYARLFSLVAIFILLIACINFMNLTTARSTKRAKEIGIRKVAGALRSSLIRQFLSEALFITVLSVLLSLGIIILLLPFFNTLTGKQIVFPFSSTRFWLSLSGLTIVTGLVAGSYPAIFLSSFRPISVLKGSPVFSRSSGMLRKGLVVFQFVLSIVLIIGTIIISRQVNYIQKANLGYNRENLIYVPLNGDLNTEYGLFRLQALNKLPIQNVSRISPLTPTNIQNGTGDVYWEGKEPDSNPQFSHFAIGYDFVKTMKLQLLAGRDFSKEFASDSTNYLINEAALKIINYKDPVGKSLVLWQHKGTIVGVLKDFHFASLHDPIKPLIVQLNEASRYGTAIIRTQPGRTTEALTSLEKICKTLNPQSSFNYSFSDEEYQRLYRNEQVVSSLSDSFAVLAIFISCIGLLGLAMFTAEQRAKEVGIRKVLGASVRSVFALLSKEFIGLVVLALAIAIPIAWFSMDRWLGDYAYRVSMDWWIFGLAGILAVFIALLTVSLQAIGVATANPIKSLRVE